MEKIIIKNYSPILSKDGWDGMILTEDHINDFINTLRKRFLGT